MIILPFILIFVILIFFFLRKFSRLKIKKQFSKAKKIIIFDKNNLNNWMNLTKKERYNLSKQDSVNYMDRRKILLDEIRNEYKKISRKNSERNIKKK